MSIKKIINVGVIGVGNMGIYHAKNYFESPQANLVAICDCRQRMGREIAKKFKCNFYKDYKKLLANKNIKAVSIVVPTELHHRVAIDSIRAGKHVLVEKPLALTVNQCREIIRAAKKQEVILTVGHIERFNPAVRKLKELIDHRRLGQIISIVAKRVGPFVSRIKDTGVLIDLATHDIDIINYLLNKRVKKIYVNGGRVVGACREDYANIFIDYGSASCYIQANWITPIKIRKLHITGTGGYAELDYITQNLDLYKSKYKRKFDKYGNPVVKFQPSPKTSLPIKFEEPLKLELKSFLTNIREKTSPEVTGEDGLRALEIVLKALKNINYV